MSWPLLVSAVLSGLAVVLVTWIAGRVGGTLGGLLATAPVTTTAALLYLGADGDVLQGGRSLSAAALAMPAFFAVVVASSRWSDRLRVTAGLAAFVAVFTLVGMLAAVVTPPGWQGMWIFVSLLLAAILATTFLHWPVAPATAPLRMATTWHEMGLRFVAGAGIIVIVDVMRAFNPSLAAAWAVFPGTFLVTLWVLGRHHGVDISARASQGGILGIPPIVAYLLTLHLLTGAVAHPVWAWFIQAPAWLAYFAALGFMRGTLPRAAAAPLPQGSV